MKKDNGIAVNYNFTISKRLMNLNTFSLQLLSCRFLLTFSQFPVSFKYVFMVPICSAIHTHTHKYKSVGIMAGSQV